MSRQYCTRCERPLVTCICNLTCRIENHVQVWFLQHPSEQKQAKGSAMLANLSLQQSKILIAEDFSAHEELQHVIDDPNINVLLLYPDDSAKVAEPLVDSEAKKTIVLILDGTWKKAYKMYQLSKNLHGLEKITLPGEITSQYRIRKHHKATDLSSLEACAHALMMLENNQHRYQPLLHSFAQFNDFVQNLANRHQANKQQ